MNHISPTFMYTNVFDADNIYKNPPQMSCHLSVLLFLIRSLAPPMTQLIAGALTTLPDPQLPARQLVQLPTRLLVQLPARQLVQLPTRQLVQLPTRLLVQLPTRLLVYLSCFVLNGSPSYKHNESSPTARIWGRGNRRFGNGNCTQRHSIAWSGVIKMNLLPSVFIHLLGFHHIDYM